MLKLLVKIARLVAIIAFICTVGFVVGLMTVALPPLAALGVVGVAGLFLLWVIPDLPKLPDTLLKRLFYMAIVVQFTTPVYYAFVAPGTPWISIRRLVWFPTVILAALMLAASSQARLRIVSLMRESKLASIFGIGFFAALLASVLTSVAWTESLADVWNAGLYWAMAFFACLLCVRDHSDVRTLMRIFCVLALIAGPAGMLEYVLERRFIFDLWPEALRNEVFAKNPQMLWNITRDTFRNGQFRSNYIYNVSLSYGEFLAVISPLATFFLVHGRSAFSKLLGFVAIITCVMGVYASGARGGYVGLAVGVPFVVTLWLIRHMKLNPSSLSGVIAAVSFAGFALGFVILAVSWNTLRYKFTGGWEGAGSTSIRMLQWELAWPWITSNPITGYGAGVGGVLVGYVTPSGTATVDSYVISLLMDAGVPALVCFFGMMIATVVMLTRTYLADLDPAAECSGAIAGAILAFGTYRLVLSQVENHFFLFALLGLAFVQIAESRPRLVAAAKARAARRFGHEWPPSKGLGAYARNA